MTGWVESIADLSATLSGPNALRAQRAAALEAFNASGLPRTSDENWRYTDISGLSSTKLEFSAAGQLTDKAMALLPIAADRVVFVNGCLDQHRTELTSAGPAGLQILTDDWSSLADGFPLNDAVVEHPLGQLNTATAQHGVLIRPGAAAESDRLIHIVIASAGNAPLALQPRIVLDLADNVCARVLLEFVSEDATPGWTNAVVEISQARGSKLELFTLQEQSPEQTQTMLVRAALQRDAAASIGCFDLGAKLARNDIDITLAGAGSEAEVFGAFLPLHSQHLDNHIRIDHAAVHTRSSTVFRGIAGEDSRGVFNGKVIVRPDAQQISAEQSSDNLLLADSAEIDTKPELEIYADDVRCSHGATIGELDESHLFYLRSRGIDETAAHALLTRAFAQTAIERIRDAELRSAIAARITARLPWHEDMEALR